MPSSLVVTAGTTGPAKAVAQTFSNIGRIEMDFNKSVLLVEQNNPPTHLEFDLALLDTFTVSIASGVATVTIENA